MPDKVSSRLRTLAAHYGISLRELAARADIPYRSVQNYVSGKQKPGAEQLIKINTQLGVSIDWLLTGEGQMFRDSDSPPASAAMRPSAELYNLVLVALEEIHRERGIIQRDPLWLGRRAFDLASEIEETTMTPEEATGALRILLRQEKAALDKAIASSGNDIRKSA